MMLCGAAGLLMLEHKIITHFYLSWGPIQPSRKSKLVHMERLHGEAPGGVLDNNPVILQTASINHQM